MAFPFSTEIPDPGPEFRRKLLHWAAKQPYCVFLDSCRTDMDRYGQYEWIAGIARSPHLKRVQSLLELKTFFDAQNTEWLFGAFSFDMKNDLEPGLKSRNPAAVAVPPLDFFVAEIVILQRKGSAQWEFALGFSPDLLLEIGEVVLEQAGLSEFTGFESQFTRAEYVEAVEQVRTHIREGETYELNLAQNFVASGRLSHPVALWEELLRVAPAPFAGFARWDEHFLLSASPERFLRLQAATLITQPIKGTAARDADPDLDAAAAMALRQNPKEQAENVMIVDLSRNDLHRVCETGSVVVPKLFEVQHFPQVHHLVSTIQGRKRADLSPLDAFCAAFPPGSMTGAPKIRTCELIDAVERSARGLYAGSLGYFAPGGDFDFNVIIRSLVHDRAKGILSYHVGGAITWDSEAEAEYEETLVKARGIAQVFR